MTTPVFHPCRFQFQDQDIRRVGSTVSGGTSLSGIDEPIETDGGGFWQADFTNGETIERHDTLAWRAINAAMDNGSAAVVVQFCDRLHQPVGDSPSFQQPSVIATSINAASLRATNLSLSITSERALIGGERFTVVHASWGERCYEVMEVSGLSIKFRPPLREAISAGTALDFEGPRCRMRRVSGPTNALNIGRYGSCAISFVEDMRKP